MRKVSLLVALVAAVALSTAANAASKKAHHHHAKAPVTAGDTGGSPFMDATDEQRSKFFHDALFPFEAK